MQQTTARVEQMLQQMVDRAAAPSSPPILAQALDHAVFPGGHRVRPKLCLAVAAAYGDDDPVLTDAAAAAIELLHCASLVHDDMPCFDNADVRRGKPSVHVAFGERIALLTGDALIVAAFECLAVAASKAGNPSRLGEMIRIVGEGVGAPHGICAGQAWECERTVDLGQYHRAKTGALFVAAACAGAAAAGAASDSWRNVGQLIGESFQVADDINDATGDTAAMGKPGGQDEILDRPSAVREHGVDGAVALLRELVSNSVDAIPECPGREFLVAVVREEAKVFFPKNLARRAA